MTLNVNGERERPGIQSMGDTCSLERKRHSTTVNLVCKFGDRLFNNFFFLLEIKGKIICWICGRDKELTWLNIMLQVWFEQGSGSISLSSPQPFPFSGVSTLPRQAFTIMVSCGRSSSLHICIPQCPWGERVCVSEFLPTVLRFIPLDRHRRCARPWVDGQKDEMFWLAYLNSCLSHGPERKVSAPKTHGSPMEIEGCLKCETWEIDGEKEKKVATTKE